MKTVEINVKAEPGRARIQYYTPNSTEKFGFNKRTRRLKRGDKNVTAPDGKLIEK